MQPALLTTRELIYRCSDKLGQLASIASGVTNDRSSSEDIVQQAVAIAIEKDHSFETSEKFMAWLAGVVRHCALNYRRKQIRRKTQSTDPNNLAVMANAGTSVETDTFDRASGDLNPYQTSFDDQLQLALSDLGTTERTCLLLRTVDGLSYAEISKLVDVPEGTAMSLVHRSKKRLRKRLAPLDVEKPT